MNVNTSQAVVDNKSSFLRPLREKVGAARMRGQALFNLINPSPTLRAFPDYNLPGRRLPARGEEIRGFTLMEVLIVVLIIAILSAIAVPQYQKAVLKSKFSQAKIMARSLAEAEELYYLENGEYTRVFSDLTMDIGGSDSVDEYGVSHRDFTWGDCEVVIPSAYAACYVAQNGERIIGYHIYLNEHPNPAMRGVTWCVAQTDLTAMSNKICQSETNRTQAPNPNSVGMRTWAY